MFTTSTRANHGGPVPVLRGRADRSVRPCYEPTNGSRRHRVEAQQPATTTSLAYQIGRPVRHPLDNHHGRRRAALRTTARSNRRHDCCYLVRIPGNRRLDGISVVRNVYGLIILRRFPVSVPVPIRNRHRHRFRSIVRNRRAVIGTTRRTATRHTGTVELPAPRPGIGRGTRLALPFRSPLFRDATGLLTVAGIDTIFATASSAPSRPETPWVSSSRLNRSASAASVPAGNNSTGPPSVNTAIFCLPGLLASS